MLICKPVFHWHLINPVYELPSNALQTRPFGDQHTDENLAEMLREAKPEWKPTGAFGFTGDVRDT